MPVVAQDPSILATMGAEAATDAEAGEETGVVQAYFAQAKKLFDKMDVNHDGHLDCAEMTALLTELFKATGKEWITKYSYDLEVRPLVYTALQCAQLSAPQHATLPRSRWFDLLFQ